MKVLFVSNDPTIFDATSVARRRMHMYAATIGELHIVSVAHNDAHGGQEGNLFLYPVQVGKLFRIYALAWRARAIIRERDIEIVSAQDPFELGLAALRAVRGTDAKLHIQVHTDFLSPWFVKSGNWRAPRVRMPFLNRIRRRYADRVLPKADGIRVVSERVKASVVARYGSRTMTLDGAPHTPGISVIPVMVDAIVPTPVHLPAHHFTFALMCVGRLESEKRIEDILAALKLIEMRYPMTGLFIAGGGHERGRLEKMVRTLGLEDKVIFLGERSDARGLMATAQAFIQASAYEGYSRTLIEAALAKVPIITTEVGIVGEVFKGHEDVLAAPVADPTALSLHIIGLIKDNSARQTLSIHAEASALAHLAAVGDIPARIAADLARTLTG